MVQRQPRHGAVVAGRCRAPRRSRRCWRGCSGRGASRPSGSDVEPLVNCRIARRSGSSAGRSSRSPTDARGLRRQVVEGTIAAPAGRRVEERRELGVDDDDARRRRARCAAGLVDELLDRAEAHRERQRDDGAAGEPDRLQRGHERPRRRPDDARRALPAHAACLQRRGHRRASSWSSSTTRRGRSRASPAAEPTKVTVALAVRLRRLHRAR